MLNSKLELRAFKPEIREAAEGQPTTLYGYAVVFSSVTDICGLFNEQVAPGAFTETLKADPIVALANHDWSKVLGRNTAGTLRLTEDKRGLKFEIDIPDTTVGRDLAVSVQRGDIDSCSFGFEALEEKWDAEQNLRTLLKCKLYEISIVANPAYGDTSVSARSAEEVHKEILAKSVPPSSDEGAQGTDWTQVAQYLDVLRSW
jgi:HK97 family phage prohead protease